MMYTTLLLAATAAVVTAQGPVYNDTTGQFVCPVGKQNAAFCAGDSLSTNIILRCTNGIASPGNCNNNLAGFFPFGVNYSPCYQSSPSAGDAACSKNCIVQGSSGNSNATFTLPNCTPVPVPSSSSTSPSSSNVTYTSVYTTAGRTYTTTSTYCPTIAQSSVATPTVAPVPGTVIPPATAPVVVPTAPNVPSGRPATASLSTVTTVPAGVPVPTPATATPVSPSGTTTARPSIFTGAAITNSASFGFAAVGIFAAYFL